MRKLPAPGRGKERSTSELTDKALQEWGVKLQVIAMVFDMTSTNTSSG